MGTTKYMTYSMDKVAEALAGVDCQLAQLENTVHHAGLGQKVRFLALTEPQWAAVRAALGEFVENTEDYEACDPGYHSTELQPARETLEHMEMTELQGHGLRSGG